MTDTPVCRRCGAELVGTYNAELVSAQQHVGALGQDGAVMVSTVLRATSACGWNCLAVLAAIEAGADADAAVQVVAERERQVTAEGFSPEGDDSHPDGQLAEAGVCYVRSATADVELVSVYDERTGRHAEQPELWPWDAEWWKPKDPERDLVRAAALVAAEADRLVRARRAAKAGRF